MSTRLVQKPKTKNQENYPTLSESLRVLHDSVLNNLAINLPWLESPIQSKNLALLALLASLAVSPKHIWPSVTLRQKNHLIKIAHLE